jgi:maltose O-acetyltransferase
MLKKFIKIIQSLILKSTYLRYYRKYDIDRSVNFNGKGVIISGEGRLSIGRNTYFGQGSSIQINVGCVVKIGDNCAISHNVRIYTMNYDPNDFINEVRQPRTITGDVVIGNNCWVGVNTVIKQGVTIGDYCVIGANSVVVKDIPSNTIVGGVPARTIRRKC